MPRQGLFLFRVSHGGGEGPFQGKQRGSRMKRRHMFRRRFFFACGCALACINGPWRNERGVRRCTSVARALLSPCAVWVPPAAKGPCGRMESQPNHRGGELGHSITLRDHLGIGTTQCQDGSGRLLHIYGADSKRGCARYLLRRIPAPAAEAAVEEEAEASGESRAKPTWAGQAAPAPEGGQAELRQIIYGREKY